MKNYKFPLLLLFCFSFVGCNNTPTTTAPVLAEKIQEISDMKKAYFSDKNSPTEINLNDYIDSKGTTLTYEISSSNPEVADAKISNNILSIDVLKNRGSADIGIDVLSNGNNVFSFEFKVTARDFTKIACVGDSLTAGHSWPSQSYPVYLNQQLSIETVNCGVNGANITSYGGSGTNYKYNGGSKTATAFNKSKTSNADVVVIMLGTNDATGWANAQKTFEDGYRELINIYQELEGVEEVILVASPPTLDGNAFSIPNENIKHYVNPIQRQVAEDLNLPLVDAREAFEKVLEEDQSKFNSYFRPNDGVHFSVDGAKFMASLVEEVIRKL